MVSVIFDLEGTLVSTIETKAEAIRESRQQTCNKLIELGIPAETLAGIERSTLMRNKAGEYARTHLSAVRRLRFERELNQFLLENELRWAEESTLFPDTIQVLRRFRKLGVRMGIVTNTSRQAAETMLAKHGLRDYFDVVVTRDDVARLKPEPQGIFLVVERLQDRDTFMIGDMGYDLEAAKKAGIKSIMIKRELPHNLLSTDSRADYTVRSLAETLEIVSKGDVLR